MPFINCKCPMCNKNTKAEYNQGIQKGEVLLFIQYNCECDFSNEIDYSKTPDDFRKEIIKESGLWQLKCFDKLKCLKFLRQNYMYSMEQIKELKQEEILTFKGTEIEIKGLGRKMKLADIDILIKRIE